MFFIGGIEIVLRLSGYALPAAVYHDARIGPRFFPNQVRTVLTEGQPTVQVTFNEWGLRGPSFAQVPAPGVTRIVCLGDSFTMGWGVRDHETGPLALQAWLDQRPGPGRYEVVNAGTSDHNTVNELRMYREVVRGLRPDIVLLGYVLNDMMPESGGMKGIGTRLEYWLQSTAIMCFLRMKLRSTGVFHAQFSRETRQRRQQFIENARVIMHEPDRAISRPYWQESMTALSELVREAAADGVKLGLLVYPSRHQIDLLGKTEAPATRSWLLQPQLRLTEEARRLGVPCLDLLETFEALGLESFGPTDRTHPSPAAHQATARRTGRFLDELGWLAAP